MCQQPSAAGAALSKLQADAFFDPKMQFLSLAQGRPYLNTAVKPTLRCLFDKAADEGNHGKNSVAFTNG